MTENRLFAGWLRSITALAAVAGTLGLSACGGGSGAPNNPFLGPLTVLPAAVVAYSGVPTTLTISGGTGPYKVFSSNPTVLPVTQTVPATTVVLLANNVAADTEVTITIQETGTVTPVGAQVPVTVTVRTAALGNSLTITPNFPDCGTNAICSGQNGTASVTVPFAGRSVRFDVIGTTYAIVSNNPAQPLVPSLTVISDANGVASVIIQANAGIPTQFAQLRVTDLTSGQQLIGNFLIQQGIDGSTIISVVPATVTFTGPDSATCSSGLTADYFIYGGTPPYRVTSTFPAFVTLVNSIVNVAGGSFRAITNGSCVDPLNFSIVDAAGLQTTAKLINKAGSGDPPVVSPAVAISPPSYTSAACTGASFSFTISGGTPPFSVASAGGAVLPNPVTTTPGSVTISGFLTGSGAHPVLVGDSAIPQRTTSATITCS